MKFGSIPIDDAIGAILAHSIGVKGRRLRKGQVLDPAAIEDLRAAGHVEVTVARLGPGDTDEDQAAQQIAEALANNAMGLRVQNAGKGRANIYATGPGVLQLKTEAINRLNSIDTNITVAILSNWKRVKDGDMIATIKIISYGVATVCVLAACKLAAGVIRHHAPAFQTVSLIETDLGDGALPEKGRRALGQRLDRLRVTLLPRTIVPHDVDALAHAIRVADGEVVCVLTASATSDAKDICPAAISAAGGRVTRFGMPVDPGNLLVLGACGKVPVIGLPGCARSPALNGADWILERVLCGQIPSSSDIARMGVGGLLKESPSRPQPRQT